MIIKAKTLSVNKCWQGRRFKTKDYKCYEQELFYKLPKMVIPQGKLELNITWGFSNKSNDIDNPTKPFLDILQKRYHFNDNKIYSLVLSKKDVKKGEEYIEFDIRCLTL